MFDVLNPTHVSYRSLRCTTQRGQTIATSFSLRVSRTTSVYADQIALHHRYAERPPTLNGSGREHLISGYSRMKAAAAVTGAVIADRLEEHDGNAGGDQRAAEQG